MPSRKRTAPHANTDARGVPAPGGGGRGAGAGTQRGLPPSGRVVASQTARAQGVTAAQRRASPKKLGFCREGRRREEGGVVQAGRVGPRRGGKKKEEEKG